MSRSRTALYIALMLATASVALAQTPLRVGPEFQVNSYTPDRQYFPVVGVAADGDFVVAWESRNQDGDSYGVFARRFNSSGIGLATEFQVNTYTSNAQRYPAVAMNGEGKFVVVWRSTAQYSAYTDIIGQRFDAAGSRSGGEFQVNARTNVFHVDPTVAIEGDGDFVVAWGSPASDPGYGIRARRFDSAGTALSADLVVNSITQEEQKHATIAMDDDGDFVIAWATQLDGSSYGIFARRFASSGGPVGIDFQVNVYTSLAQVAPAAAMDADGDFVIVWQSYPQDFSASGVFGRRFASSGASQGTEFQVNLYTFLNQQSPAVGMEPDGDFVVAWQSLLQDTSGYAVMARRFASAGNGLGAEFQVNSNTGSAQRRAAVDTAAGGAFVVAWESEDQDGAYTGVFGQRFDEIGTLDVDGNGVISALTDGLLFLRFAFQFSGTTLTNGAVGPGCTRCDATAVTGYLNGLGLVLDIDGNGAIQPLADGLLVLRFEFGFTGTTLTSGAVGPGCTRCDHTTILPYLQSL